MKKIVPSKSTYKVMPRMVGLMKSGPGDTVVLHAPGTTEELEILEVRYELIPIPPFEPVKSQWSPNA